MSDAAQTQTLEQTLNKTDLGHVIYENRNLFFGLLVTVVFAATGYSLWRQSQKSAALETAVKVFEFQSTVWADVKAGKKAPADLVTAFEGLDPAVQSAPVMIPMVLEMSKFLAEKGSYAEAGAVLSKVSAGHPVSTFFLALQKAVVLEKLGKVGEAIAALEPLAQSKEAFLPARTSLELGRLYLVKGEKAKAQTQFDYVVNTFPNGEEAKLAKLYRQRLASPTPAQ
jgi:predicted negative regulator of RcsB-dependent stress response